MKRTSLTLLLAILLSMVGIDAWADGYCGYNVTWTLSGGTLTISGTGEMFDYNNKNISPPWNSSKGSITTIVINEGVTSIGICAFRYCSGLTSVTIGNSVTSIGEAAFSFCSSLTSVTIPNSVTSIGDGAFSYCSALASVSIGNNVTSMGKYVFTNCSNITELNLDCPTIENWFNDSKSQIKTVTLGNGVTSVGGNTFSGCSSLTSITIPNSVTSIGESAFDGTAWLNNQPDGVVYVGKNVYVYKGDMPNNTSIVIEEGTFSITSGAFRYCSGLTSITIPNSVTSIGDKAFLFCSGLTSITIPNSVTSIGDKAFWSCSGLTSVTISNSVTSIGNSVFFGCSGLTSIIIPNSVTSIGNSAFFDCGLSSIIIGSNVASIGYDAFSSWSGWLNFYSYAKSVPKAVGAFFTGSSYYDATLHVPAESIEFYRMNKPWNNFKKIVALTDDDPKPTGLTNINNDIEKGERYYSLDGKRMIQPQRGLNIIRKSDGTTSKVVVK